jgi:hypothetical protein
MDFEALGMAAGGRYWNWRGGDELWNGVNLLEECKPLDIEW